MADDTALRQDLLLRIEARRAGVQAYLRTTQPRARRRSTLTIVLSSLAAVFTAGPAVGGQSFSDSVQGALKLPDAVPAWRLLCLLALLVSVGAAVLTNLNKAQDVVARLSVAEAAGAELEGLATLVLYGQLSLPDAVKLYQQYIVKIPFIPDLAPTAGPVAAGQWPVR